MGFLRMASATSAEEPLTIAIDPNLTFTVGSYFLASLWKERWGSEPIRLKFPIIGHSFGPGESFSLRRRRQQQIKEDQHCGGKTSSGIRNRWWRRIVHLLRWLCQIGSDRSDRVIRYSIRVFTSIVIIVFIVIFILKYIKENFFIFLY